MCKTGKVMSSYDIWASEFLRALRGSRSQIALARRLGYSGNPITDWENGRRYPKLSQVWRIAVLLKRPITESLKFLGNDLLEESCRKFPGPSIFLALKGSTPFGVWAEQSGFSRFTLSRWCHGEGEPRLPEFLQLLERSGRRHIDWMNSIVSIENIPSLSTEYGRVVQARSLAFEKPLTELLLRAVECRAYLALQAHDEDWLARFLGVSKDVITALISALSDASLIEKRGNHFVVIGELHVDMKSEPQRSKQHRKYWADFAAMRHPIDKSDDWFAYNVMSLNRTAAERVEKRLRDAFREVRTIVANQELSQEELPEEVKLLTIQLSRWHA